MLNHMSSIVPVRPEASAGKVPSLVVLIDGDNASSKIVAGLLAEIANYGVAVVRRVYGDWTKPNLAGWKSCLLDHSIQPIQQFAYTTGKNATDSSLIIDAMDLLHSGRFDGFCIVSSDSDFTRLASRIREQGLTVYGFGENRTPKAFVSACDKFIFVDVLREQKSETQPKSEGSSSSRRRRGGKNGRGSERPPAPAPEAVPFRVELSDEVASAIRTAVAARADEDGWTRHDTIGNHISRIVPSFDPRNYGVSKLIEVLTGSGLVETRRSESGRFWLVRLLGDVVPVASAEAEAPAATAASDVEAGTAPSVDTASHAAEEVAAAPKKKGRRRKRVSETATEAVPAKHAPTPEAEAPEPEAASVAGKAPPEEVKPKKKSRPRKRKD